MDLGKIVEYFLLYWRPTLGLVFFVVFLFLEWKDNKLTRILDLVVEWLRQYAADELQDVTREESDTAVGIFYEHFIQDTFLGKFVTLAKFQTLVWAAFCKLRNAYIVANYALSPMPYNEK